MCSVELRENNVTLCTMYLPTTIFVWLLTKKKNLKVTETSNIRIKFKVHVWNEKDEENTKIMGTMLLLGLEILLLHFCFSKSNLK